MDFVFSCNLKGLGVRKNWTIFHSLDIFMYLHNKISTDVMRCLATRDGSSFVAIAIAISAWTIPMSMAMATKLEPSLLAIYHLFVLSSISSIDIVI